MWLLVEQDKDEKFQRNEEKKVVLKMEKNFEEKDLE
jgi:hypothetical protein